MAFGDLWPVERQRLEIHATSLARLASGVDEEVDIAIVGAGAAGLMAAIAAGRARVDGLRIVTLDGARKLGAKILVAGGGRCNVTHHAVDESAYAGSSRPAIRKVLRAFDVARTLAFFNELGVELKREETGKLFPTTDDAHTVLEALLGECRRLGVELRHPWRVASIERDADGLTLTPAPQADGVALPAIHARRVILATGGLALPKSGSDGAGYAFARSLGHSVTPRVLPALVPLTLADGCFIRELSGLAVPTSLEVRSGTGKRLMSFTNSTLCTHFGLSGPGPLDVSRYFFDTLHHDAAATLRINWLPGQTLESLDALFAGARQSSPLRVILDHEFPPPAQRLPERLARALCAQAGVEPTSRTDHLSREKRRALAVALADMTLPVTGTRGFTYAEVTAGGVPLSELHLDSMASRVCPGLFVIGEICDVDGRIGGFNFQWAWASGHLAGSAAARVGANEARNP